MFEVTLINGDYRTTSRFNSIKSARKAAKTKLNGQMFYAFACVIGEGLHELYGKSHENPSGVTLVPEQRHSRRQTQVNSEDTLRLQ